MNHLPTWRLYLLRAAYLLMVIGLAAMIWPLILQGHEGVEHMRGVSRALLGAIGLLAVLGLRYPVQMLPLLLFEFTWKVIWLATYGLPRLADGTLDAAHRASLFDCGFGVVLMLVVIPWGHVWRNYVRRPGDRWRGGATTATMGAAEVR